MARVKTIGPEALPPEAAAVYRRFLDTYGPFDNQVAVFAQVPAALQHLMGLLLDLRAAATLPRRDLEIALVTVSRLNDCAYCVAHHRPKLSVEGLPDDAIEAIPYQPEHPALTDRDRLVIDYASRAWQDPRRIDDALFARLRQHFDEAQIVELTLRATLCGFFNRFNDALRIEEEAEAAA